MGSPQATYQQPFNTNIEDKPLSNNDTDGTLQTCYDDVRYVNLLF